VRPQLLVDEATRNELFVVRRKIDEEWQAFLSNNKMNTAVMTTVAREDLEKKMNQKIEAFDYEWRGFTMNKGAGTNGLSKYLMPMGFKFEWQCIVVDVWECEGVECKVGCAIDDTFKLAYGTILRDHRDDRGASQVKQLRIGTRLALKPYLPRGGCDRVPAKTLFLLDSPLGFVPWTVLGQVTVRHSEELESKPTVEHLSPNE